MDANLREHEVLVVGSPALATRLRTAGLSVLSGASVREALSMLPALAADSAVVISDVTPLRGAVGRRELATSAGEAGHPVLALSSYTGKRMRCLEPFGSSRLLFQALEPTVTFADVLVLLGVEPTPEDWCPIPSLLPVFQQRAASTPIVGWKRGRLLLGPDGQVRVSGAFSGVPVSFDSDAFCDYHPEHPRGIPEPDIGCYGGFSAHSELLAALRYGPADGPLLTVELSGNLLLAGSPAADLDLNAGHQRVTAIELVDACISCANPTPCTVLAAGFVDEGWTSMVPRCEAHASGARFELADLPALLDEAAGYPVRLTWRRGIAAGVLHHLGYRQRRTSRAFRTGQMP